MDIGELIKYIREEQGKSQLDVASWCDIQRKTVMRIEQTGRGNYETIEKILSVLGYELEVVPING